MITRSFLWLILSSMLSACSQSVIESKNINNLSSPRVDSLEEGGVTSVSYFLPRQRAKVTVESKKTTHGEVEKARQALLKALGKV